jgi:hypothetical protein
MALTWPFFTALHVKGRQADVACLLAFRWTCDWLHRAFLWLYSWGKSNATFARPDLTRFTRLDELGLEVVGQAVGAGSGGAGLPYSRTGSVVSPLRLRGPAL